MGQVSGRFSGQQPPPQDPPGVVVPPEGEAEQHALLPIQPNAPADNETSFLECVGQCCSGCQNCCGMTVQWVKDCCVSCCSGVTTLLGGCFGCCSLMMGRCEPYCPLSKRWAPSKKGLAALLDNVATICVMGIFSLNMYCATYFVAWAPSTVNCLSELPISVAVTKWVKVVVIGLPFTLFPPTLYVAGQAKALEFDLRALGFVTGAVLLEIVYMVCLGAVMTVCTFTSVTASPPASPSDSPTESPWKPVAVVTSCLLLLLVIAWGCCCHYPKWLRSLLGCFCCWCWTCQQVDLEAPAPAPAQAQAPAPATAAAALEAAKAATAALEAAVAAAPEAPPQAQ